MTTVRPVRWTLCLSLVLALSHLGCGGSEASKKPSTIGAYTPSEKGEDQIKVAAVSPSSHRAVEPAAQPAPAPAAAEATPVAAQPAAASETAATAAEPASDDDEDTAAAEPAPHKATSGKKSKKHHRSKKHHK